MRKNLRAIVQQVLTDFAVEMSTVQRSGAGRLAPMSVSSYTSACTITSTTIARWFHPSSAEPTKELLDEVISVSLPRSLMSIPDRAYLHWQGSTFVVRSCRRGNHVVLDVRAEEVPARLTARELDISTLLIEGLTNAQIAETLRISTKTASRHVENIMAKLGVSNRATAAVRCAEAGLRSWEFTDRIAR
ncbi:response regulator transcription factor [Nocardia abscessus]|uniref:response regulator transcription factor n=1 Tax=Nocardia abscessus TaxID=120957 RepID=UPI002455A64E|nr:LuxR C-terminal-related transcriptional regulator [Nocardia abscessus]